MDIKRINNVIGYKDLPDGFNADFSDNKTYIIGANFQRKTTVGSLFNWCLTGTNLYGKEKEQVANDIKKPKNVIVDISFIDNFGIEHRLVRDKAKDINLILDGKEIKQEMLVQFYKDKDAFLVAHNPYYFQSLEPKEQKNLLRNILPAISPEESFNFLNDYEKKIINKPIESLSRYIDLRNNEINTLEKEYNSNLGKISAYSEIALQAEGETLEFDKEKELQKLNEKYEIISKNLEGSNLDDLERSINIINERLKEILQVKLSEISKEYDRENKKLNEINKQKSICPSCRQEIKNSESKQHLIKFYQKELNNIQEKSNKLKEDATTLVNERKKKAELYEKLNTTDMKKIQSEKNVLKEKINNLQKEKNQMLLHNKEVTTIKQQILNAKNNLELCKKVQEEILSKLELSKIQKKIANKLKILEIEAQKEKIKRYLNKVDIEFSKMNKTTGEIVECCNIQYEGRDYKKLSKSQQARACLEISNVFNNISGIKAPIFFDDAESTTDIEDIENTQMIISFVIKYNKLEILYDYEDVLDRKQKSIEREIEERSGFANELAA